MLHIFVLIFFIKTNSNGISLDIGDGEFVEKGDKIASAKKGTKLSIPKIANVKLNDVSKKSNVNVTVSWQRKDVKELNPTMHVLVANGSQVYAGEKIVGAIDAAQEIFAEASGTIKLAEPASILVSRAKIYIYDDEPLVANGDRVLPGDEIADEGKIKADISGRVELNLTSNQIRLIESYDFDAKMGAEAIKELLTALDLKELEAQLVEEMESPSRHKRTKARKRLEIVRNFINSGNHPAWMILEAMPIMPPSLRPMVQVEGGRFATSDINDLYRRLINRNNRLKKLIAQGAPEMIIRNEKRMLQEAVDALIDNGRRGSPVVHPGSDRALRSLADLLGGKQGRFRQNLLGKRVDYSGRSVIVVGPQLKLHQCGVPKKMALELFKPFLLKELQDRDEATNIKSARKMLERHKEIKDEIWDALESVIQDMVVLLNRAPTLHRLGIQGFEPVLVEGKAIQLHPLVCESFNADFDGDQMAIHVPLSVHAQTEAKLQMLSSHNLLSPAHGAPNVQASRDIILGLFVLTQLYDGHKGAGKKYSSAQKMMKDLEAGLLDLNSNIFLNGKATTAGQIKYRFSDVDEALLAVERGQIDMQDLVSIKIDGKIIATSAGRVFFARMIKETLAEDGIELPASLLSYDTAYEKKALKDLVIESFKLLGLERTAKLLDGLKSSGFTLSTTSGITIGIDDVAIPPQKEEIIHNTRIQLKEITNYFQKGFLTEKERYNQVIKLWTKTTEDVRQAVFKHFEENLPFNPLFIMANSGARGNPQQIKQLAGMRGLMQKPSGETIELPIESNFREGLTVLEYFISTHGARKGGADTALRTADSGYLTRKLVDVAHEIVVREDDCHTADYLDVDLFDKDKDGVYALRDRGELDMALYGRSLAADLEINDQSYKMGYKFMMEDIAYIYAYLQSLDANKDDTIRTIAVRSPLTCQTRSGVCRECYGLDLSTMKKVSLGETVGVIAAESIGEPGTQLTMRTFHTGGIATGADITQGLPRVIELVEARKPKVKAVIAKLDGIVSSEEKDKRFFITVTSEDGDFSETYKSEPNASMIVKDGEYVESGQPLTRGAINPHDLLESRGPDAVRAYLVNGIQGVYRNQGVSVHDKHIEVIIRQMLKYVEILDPGDSNLLEGQVIERFDIEEQNNKLLDDEKTPITWKPVLLGITKSSLSTKSWLSAASFQHTTHVLTEAAIAGKVDNLVGLKENVILGRLIPSGTGLLKIRDINVADKNMIEKSKKRSETRTIAATDEKPAKA
ncbi:MAG TPA: DNA-directed RNA polymerase subunit beta' [Trueperaceae bacterium]|nr:DNA-directed RNA polymerase subunit beta' [Trueperaceae bacterium]